MTPEHVEQPMPTRNDRPSIQSLVRADLDEREQVGIQRYGTPLQAFNGRDALRDAYEEALDLACYLRQAMAERDLATVVQVPPGPCPSVQRGLFERNWRCDFRAGHAGDHEHQSDEGYGRWSA